MDKKTYEALERLMGCLLINVKMYKNEHADFLQVDAWMQETEQEIERDEMLDSGTIPSLYGI